MQRGAEPGAWAADQRHHPPARCRRGQPRAPGPMAAAGTWGEGGPFPAQKELVLEPLCWLDPACERARRDHLYGQLCCVGGCLWPRGELAQGGHRSPRERPRPGRGGARPRCSPAPRLCSGNTWEEGGVLGLARSFPFWRKGRKEGGPARVFALVSKHQAVGLDPRWSEAQEGGGAGAGLQALCRRGALLREASEAGERGVHPQQASHPDASSLAVGPLTLVSITVKGGVVPQRNMGSSRGHWAEGHLPLGSSGVRQMCWSASAGGRVSWGGSAELCIGVGASGLAGRSCLGVRVDGMGRGGSCTSQGQGRREALWRWDGMGSGPGGAGGGSLPGHGCTPPAPCPPCGVLGSLFVRAVGRPGLG